jgi:hypothetical protein
MSGEKNNLEPLSTRVEETIRLGFTPLEGIKLVGIYDNGYRLIRQLIVIRDEHKDPGVRVEAKRWLQQIDEKDGIGTSFQAILGFVQRSRTRRPKAFTWRKLTSQKHQSIGEALKRLRARADVSDDVRRRIDELLASIVEDKMPGQLYAEARTLLANHKVSKRVLAKRINSASTYAHAIIRACELCDNLSELSSFVLEEDRAMLVARLCAAASVLLKVQSEILEKGGSDDQARTRSDEGGARLDPDQKSLGGLGPGPETVQREVGQGDS